jgi:hypothetical protein
VTHPVKRAAPHVALASRPSSTLRTGPGGRRIRARCGWHDAFERHFECSAMRKFCYWFCFLLVALGPLLYFVPWLGIFLAVGTPMLPLGPLSQAVALLLMLGTIVLVLRRAWLTLVRREGLPASFTGILKWMAYAGVASLVLGAIAFALSVALQLGSGVPAAMVAMPAKILIPWVVFLTEALSLRKTAKTTA